MIFAMYLLATAYYDVDETQQAAYDIIEKMALRTKSQVSNLCNGHRACTIMFDDAGMIIYKEGDYCALAHEIKHSIYGPKHSKKLIYCGR